MLNTMISSAPRFGAACLILTVVLTTWYTTVKAEAITSDLTTAELSYVKGILRSRCADCHSAEASTTDFDVLDPESMLKAGLIQPNRPGESKLIQIVTTDEEQIRMPQDLPPLSTEEIEKLSRWISAGAKAFPKDVESPTTPGRDAELAGTIGVEYVLNEILNHQRSLPANDARHYRYFSCNHLLTRGATREEIQVQRDALAKTINHLTYEREPVELETVDRQTGTLFTVDIRRLGWHTPILNVAGDLVTPRPTLNTYDLLLLEYPYSIRYEGSETYDRLVAEYIKPAGLVREIPWLRTDWFTSNATQPYLYHDLMRMPFTVQELEKEIIGVDVDRMTQERQLVRGAVVLSGVSRNNRAAERYQTAHGAYWKSIDYASNKGDENIFRDPLNLHGVGGEMIFNLPNGLQGYYLADGQGHRIDAGPTEIVTDKFAEDKVVRNAISCLRCHDQGMKKYKDAVRPAVENLPGHPGFSKAEVLRLYPPAEQFAALLKQDGDRFLAAMEKVLGHSQEIEPVTPVSRRFLDDPIPLSTASGELGLANSEDMVPVFRSRQFVGLGLAPLAAKGAVRRDTWEDYYDQIVSELGLGLPVIPLDAVSRNNYAPLNVGPKFSLSTSRGSRFFAPGDELAITVKNTGNVPIFIELVGTGTKGEKIVLAPAGTQLSANEELRFPESGNITVKPSLGQELITVFASEQKFPPGVLYKGKNVSDRYVHEDGTSGTSPIIKKTLVIETR